MLAPGWSCPRLTVAGPTQAGRLEVSAAGSGVQPVFRGGSTDSRRARGLSGNHRGKRNRDPDGSACSLGAGQVVGRARNGALVAKIAILGAYGELGRVMSLELARLAPDHTLLLAGRDAHALERLCSEVGRVEAVQFDVRDQARAVEALDGVDLVVSCMTLAVSEETFAVAAAAGANYTDLLSSLDERHAERAREAGIVAVPGLGLTPGLSNVLVRHAADDMQPIHEAEISYVLFRAAASSEAILDSTLWGFSDHTEGLGYTINGRFRRARPAEGSKVVRFPAPFGEIVTYFRPHPEARTLPQSFPSVQFCAVRAAYPPIQDDMRVLNKYGLLDPDAIDDTRAAIWRRLGGKTLGTEEGLGAMVVEVRGQLLGHDTGRRYSIAFPSEGAMYPHTATCAAVGVVLIAEHGAPEPGVVPPERYFDPVEYLDVLARQGVVRVTWDDTPLDDS